MQANNLWLPYLYSSKDIFIIINFELHLDLREIPKDWSKCHQPLNTKHYGISSQQKNVHIALYFIITHVEFNIAVTSFIGNFSPIANHCFKIILWINIWIVPFRHLGIHKIMSVP